MSVCCAASTCTLMNYPQWLFPAYALVLFVDVREVFLCLRAFDKLCPSLTQTGACVLSNCANEIEMCTAGAKDQTFIYICCVSMVNNGDRLANDVPYEPACRYVLVKVTVATGGATLAEYSGHFSCRNMTFYSAAYGFSWRFGNGWPEKRHRLFLVVGTYSTSQRACANVWRSIMSFYYDLERVWTQM
jgi:hypothetical protein